MANFDGVVTADPSWVDVPQLSAVCQALGGPGGPMNAQAVAIVARLGFLANAISAISSGSKLLTGTGAPSDGLGANGDLYIDPTALVLYGPKAAGSWPAGVSLQGPAGPAGGSGGFTNCVVVDAAGTDTWVVPPGVVRLMCETTGGGQGGGKRDGAWVSGGTGGSYGRALFVVTPGDTITRIVGDGGAGAPGSGSDVSVGSPGGLTFVGKLGAGGYSLSQSSTGQDDFTVSGSAQLVESIRGQSTPGLSNYESGGASPKGGFGGVVPSTPAGIGGGGFGSSSNSDNGQNGAAGRIVIWY